MSSRRFPGKVLAPFLGRPVLAHVLSSVSKVVPRGRIVLATSVERSDDPLAGYAASLGFAVFRGPLEDVFGRFCLCLKRHPCDWFFRISADSPLLDPGIMRAMLPNSVREGADIVTNVFPRTFPKGQSAELLRSETFVRIDPCKLTACQKEHVTPVYYEHPLAFRIRNVRSGRSGWSRVYMDVSVPADLGRLERRFPKGVKELPGWSASCGGT